MQRILIICGFWNLRQLWSRGGLTEMGMALTLMLHRMVEVLALLFILCNLVAEVSCQLDYTQNVDVLCDVREFFFFCSLSKADMQPIVANRAHMRVR